MVKAKESNKFHFTFDEINEMKSVIKDSRNIVILTHTNPDGDSVGSSLAMYYFCKRLQKNNTFNIKNIMYCGIHNIPKSFLSFFENENIYCQVDYIPQHLIKDPDTLILALDSASAERCIPNYEKCKDEIQCKIMVIDHHVSNTKFGNFNYVKEAASCSELIFEVINVISKSLKSDIMEKEAVILYVGMKTDTGNFTYSYVDSKTLYHAYLISTHLDDGKLSEIDEILQKNKDVDYHVVFSKCLSTLKYFKENKISVITCKKDFYYKSQTTLDSLKNLVNFPFQIIPVKMSILITEIEENEIYNLSIRSKLPFKAKGIAEHFNGGGHECAAGAVITGKTYSEIIDELKVLFDEI